MEKIKVNKDNNQKIKTKKKEDPDIDHIEEWTEDVQEEKIEVFTE